MPPKSKTPAGKAGASRDQIAVWSHSVPTVAALQVQTLILAYAVRPELAAMVAALAFAGHVA